MKNKLIVIFTVILLMLLLFSNSINAKPVLLGNYVYDESLFEYVAYTDVDEHENILGISVTVEENCYIKNGYANLYSTDQKGDVLMILYYSSNGTMLDYTNSLTIDQLTNYWYNFTFVNQPVVSEGLDIDICVYGNSPSNYGEATALVYVTATDMTNSYYANEINDYPNIPDPILWDSSDNDKEYSLYVYYDPIDTACDNTSITVYNNTQKVTGKYQTLYSSLTGWKIWLNFTGLAPTLIKKETIKNATGTHQSKYWSNNYTFKVWANYSGNTTAITWVNNHINTVWTHYKTLLVNNSWKIYDNDTGNTTSITWSNNHKNTTWSHTKILLLNNSWHIFDNDTGNITVGINISKFHIFLNLLGVIGFINWSGDIISTSNNISFNITSNMTINGTANVNDTGVWLYLGAVLTFENGQFFLLILIGLWSYFIYLYYKEKEVIFSFCIICCGLPLGIILSGVAYYNSYPFGYLISFILILISFLIPTYGMYEKNKKKNNK